MDLLETSIAGSCPAFSGASGALFVKAVITLIATHCSLLEDDRWPEDNAKDIFLEGFPTYDFAVVGAGTAGTILASRLSEDFPSHSILLIEAGDDPGLESKIPGLMFRNQNTATDWNYKTHPNKQSCLGFVNNSCIWSKGRTMGGSNSINAMLYIRGHPEDFNEWNDLGNEGWKYEDLKPYFSKIEHELQLFEHKYTDNPWYNIIQGAYKELNIDKVNNENEAHVGTQITKLLIKDGKRYNFASYLKNRRNLFIMKNTIVHRITSDITEKSVTGLEVEGTDKKKSININNEIIIAAGSIATPQILMRSGIGPKTHLLNNYINSIADLPVGINLQDHLFLPIFLKTNLHTNVTSKEINSILFQYITTKSGPFSNIGITDFMGFISTKGTERPTIQFHHIHFTRNDKFMLSSYLKGVGYRDEIIEEIERVNLECDLLGIYPTLLHPKSRGVISLSNSNPRSTPFIMTSYLKENEDLNTLLTGIDFIRNLTYTDTFKSLGIVVTKLRIPECLQNIDVKYWECYIRHMATTIYHPVGTAKMGTIEDGGVVSSDLLVHGFKNLRVVDASIMPTITSGNTMAPTMVIAEKAADIIKKQYEKKDEL